MRFLCTLVVLFAVVVAVSSFRGGHGRPLYGVIGDSYSANNGVPMRGLYAFGGRAAAAPVYDAWRK